MVWICFPGQILVFLVETDQFEDQDIWHIPQLFCWSDRFCLRQHLEQDLEFENNIPPKINLFKSSISEMLPPSLPSKRKICTSLNNGQFTVQLGLIFLMLYTSTVEEIWSASFVLWKLITYICLFESTSKQWYVFPKNRFTTAREAQLCNQLYSGHATQTGYAFHRSEGFQI